MQLRFLGAAREVTGSCFLIESGGRRMLVDCGLIQGSSKEEARNRNDFPFDPRAIDAVVLTHAHLDHSGRLPLLIKRGYRGPIYAHAATRDLARIMLRDAGFLNERDAEYANRKRRRKWLPEVAPLYTMAEASTAVRRFHHLDYGERRELLPGVEVRLSDAGHILGSSIVEVWLAAGDGHRKLVFSGDLGHRDAPILRDPEQVRAADLVVMESTYGDRLHRPWEATHAELAAVLAEAAEAGGNVLIPSFAVGRTQDLLYLFQRHYTEWGVGRWAVFLDSPMAIQATEVYARHFSVYDREARAARAKTGDAFRLPNLHISRTTGQSMAINRIRSGAIVIAGSGMCTGGRILHHFKHNLWRRDCHVVIVGFQARGTLGRRLVDGAQHVRLWGETIRVAATVHTIGGLSAHADQAGLLDWYGKFENRPPVALVHGEPEAQDALAQRLGQKAHRVMVPELGEVLDLIRLERGHSLSG
jgi:metallo-beta-lactamase family protein